MGIERNDARLLFGCSFVGVFVVEEDEEENKCCCCCSCWKDDSVVETGR